MSNKYEDEDDSDEINDYFIVDRYLDNRVEEILLDLPEEQYEKTTDEDKERIREKEYESLLESEYYLEWLKNDEAQDYNITLQEYDKSRRIEDYGNDEYEDDDL